MSTDLMLTAPPRLQMQSGDDFVSFTIHPAGFGRVVRKLLHSRIGSKCFEENVFADRVDKSTQPLRMLQTTFVAENVEDSNKCLLPDILNQLRRTETRPQLYDEKVAEIAREMTFCFRLTLNQALDIASIKSLALQISPYPVDSIV